MIDPAITAPESKLKRGLKILRLALLVILFAAAAALLLSLAPSLTRNEATVGVSGANEALQARVDSLDGRLRALEMRVDALPAIPAAAPAATSAAARDDGAAKLQNDVAALSSAMTALQTEVRATGVADVTARAVSASAMAAIAAYVRLNDAAMAGRPFAAELAAMRDAAKNDNELLGLVARLEPFAGGAPTPSALGADLAQRRPAVAVAVAKGEAQNWWQRLFAELRGLITVRPLHDGEGDALMGLENALAGNDDAAAMEAFKALPVDAQHNLADWKKQLDARRSVDDGLKDIAAHFAAPAKNP